MYYTRSASLVLSNRHVARLVNKNHRRGTGQHLENQFTRKKWVHFLLSKQKNW